MGIHTPIEHFSCAEFPFLAASLWHTEGMTSRVLSLLILLIACTTGLAQPAAATKYKVRLRYYIPAPRDPHVAQYDSMIRHLVGIKFEFDPPRGKDGMPKDDTDREDRSKNYLDGAIAADKARKLLDHPAVQTIQLIPLEPNEVKLPEGPNDPVTVRVELAGKLSPDRQRELSNQTRVLLREFGFKEPVGYDHRGYAKRSYTRIVGTIPASKLEILIRDLRNHPAGWIGPIIPRDEIPSPMREVNPVQVIEVMPDNEAVKELTDPDARPQEEFEKIAADLWELVKGKDVPGTTVRVQVGFVGTLADERAWKTTFEELTPGFFVEAQFGQFVTGTLRLDQVKILALSPLVSVIRLPRVPQVDVDPAIKIKGNNKRALEQTGLKELHERGYKGKGVRLAIVDRDFRGWEKLVQAKQLPVRTRLIDLSAETSPDILPLPYRGDPATIGHGTQCAQAAALAAPDCELTLLRVDVGDPHQLAQVARYIHGAANSSRHMEQRNGELLAATERLRVRHAELMLERRAILDDFTDETDLKDNLEFLGPFFGWLYSDREWHRERMAFFDRLETEHRQREERFRTLMRDIKALEGIAIVVNAISWHSGYPQGATSALAKMLDEPKGPLWFQSVGNTRGQSWHGPYRNILGDPALKFVADAVPLHKGRWSNEVNFLGWSPYHGDPKPDLPEKAMLRLTIQWREPHEPEYYLRAEEEDYYRRPLAHLRMQLLRQRDPEGKSLQPDAFELVARTSGWAQRLEHLPGSSVYEHVLEVPIEKAGRYAIRVERQGNSVWFLGPHPVRRTPTFQYIDGLTPTGIRPLGFDAEKFLAEIALKGVMPRPQGIGTLPALEKDWDLRPRIFAEVLDEPNRLQGRPVFVDYPTEAGAIGLPADARNVLSVGAASLEHKVQPYSAFGSPSGMELARRPRLYAYDELELVDGGGAFGTSIANAFAAGTTAAMLSGRLTREDVVQMLHAQEGQVLRVPFGKK